MEASDSIWRNNLNGVFSRSSSHEANDEEALKWAAMEKLPTYNRLRTGILAGLSGSLREVDISRLGSEEKKHLLDRLVAAAEDNEEFLFKLKSRFDRVGIQFPTIEVRFGNLRVEAEAYVGSRALPTIFNSVSNVLEGLLSYLRILPSKKQPFSILDNVSGIIKPCRLTLLLGPPGSGKTTLLLALAGRLGKELKASGRVTYNGHEMDEFVPGRTSAYISQHDLHIGEMTVRETLAFSARCQGVGWNYEMLSELCKREKMAKIKPDPDIDVYMKAAALEGQEASVVTEYIMKILGLDACADTLVGDQMIRGISGGQRKRLTTGEMLVGPARAFFMDEISTGLDSSTTFQIVNSIKQSIHILNGTAILSLLQPAPETFELFDDIVLLSDGCIVYQGPRQHVLEFFEIMGFRCPERKGVADFLQEVTSRKDQEQYWLHKEEPYRFISAREFSETFRFFHIGRELADKLALPFDKTKSHPAALAKSKYGVSKRELFKACFEREYLLMKRNPFLYIFQVSQMTITSVAVTTLFLRTEMHRNSLSDGDVFMGALFFGLTTFMFNALPEVAVTVAKLPVFYKQRDLQFYPAWAYSLPIWILRIPLSFALLAPWSIICYYGMGFDPNAKSFFKQSLLLLLVSQMAFATFRLIGALSRNMAIAYTFGSFFLVAIMSLGGFVLSREDVKPWWKWGYWISPLMYGQNALTVNEFQGSSWNHTYQGAKESLGVLVMKSRGFFIQEYWYWIGLSAQAMYTFLFNIGFTLALAYLNPLEKPQAVVPEEGVKENHARRREQSVENQQRPKHSETVRKRANTRRFSTAQNNASTENNYKMKKGMVLPFTPLSLVFENIRYSIDMPQEMKKQGALGDRLELLKGVSGAFRPGVLTALMGVSGAGKTTLMDVLAGRKTGGYIEGNIFVSGFSKNQQTFARISGYCEQNDIHSPHLTVLESLQFSAWLRLPQEVDSATREMFIEEIMELVELTSLKEALVGLPGVSGLSTEKRKRLTVAVELVANPSIVFMDEPTSGLDARAAAIVMRTVRKTVDTGRTVVCTIHQPSTDIFEAFDELFLLKRGGEEIYVGPLGYNSCDLVHYFQGIQGVPTIKDGRNPATWMLDVTTTNQEEALGVDFAVLYKNSELFRRNKALIQELSHPIPGSQEIHFLTQYSQPFLTQCIACLWKQHWSYWRNASYNTGRMFFTTIIALLYGSLFWGLGSNMKRKQGLLNASGCLFTAIQFLGLLNASLVQPVVDVERTVFYREKAARMYSALPYAFGQAIIEFLYAFFQTVIYGVIVYAMMGFEWTVAKFFWYSFFLFFSLTYFTFYGMMVMAMSPNIHIASIISSAFYAVWSLFSGFLIPQPRIPSWWKWYYWCSPLAWTLYGLMASQFGDLHYEMGNGLTASEFLNVYFGYKQNFIGVVAIVVVGFTLIFAFGFAVSMKLFNFQRR